MAIYREIVERKKIPVILILFIILTIIIYLADFFGKFMIGDYSLNFISKLMFTIIMLLIMMHELKKCIIKYRYSVIEDEFIVHKLMWKDERIVEDIKFKDIKFIGILKKGNSKFNIQKSKKYIASLLNTEKYCCIYANGGKLKKFYFEPSENLIKKIKYEKKDT